MKIKNSAGVIIALVIVGLLIISALLHSIKPISVIIQAGHEGRGIGNTGSRSHLYSETVWNIYVANEIAKQLKAWGIEVKRVPADINQTLKAKIAVAIHFDGANKRCSSGASIGYPDENSKEFAKKWKSLYKPYFPFKWHKDNFTENLKNYYGYAKIKAEKFLVLELGEISCPKQVKWLKPRLKTVAHLIAYAIAKELGLNRGKPYLK